MRRALFAVSRACRAAQSAALLAGFALAPATAAPFVPGAAAGAATPAASAAPASASAAPAYWLCGLSDDLTRLVCVADTEPELGDEPVAGARPTAVVNGTAFPLDPRRRYVVDFWSPPSEPERLHLLARATICYRSPGCQVQLVLPGDLQRIADRNLARAGAAAR